MMDSRIRMIWYDLPSGDLSIKDGGSFHTYVSLPEGNAKQNMHNLQYLESHEFSFPIQHFFLCPSTPNESYQVLPRAELPSNLPKRSGHTMPMVANMQILPAIKARLIGEVVVGWSIDHRDHIQH